MISIDFTLIMTIINFAILYFALKMVLFNPLLEFLERREKVIEQNNQEAVELKEQSDKLAIQYQESIRQGKKEANNIVTTAKQKAWSKRMAEIESLQNKNVKDLDEIKREVEKEALKAEEDLQSKIADVSQSITAKIVGRAV